MAHEVRLDVFEGPIDLLLHLITRRRVDIYDVPLAAIAEDYLDAVRAMPRVDLEGATGFLVVAATLLELKSARLLPAQPSDAEGSWLEERDLLLARLVECATFQEAGTWIATRLDAGRAYLTRSVGLDGEGVEAPPPRVALEDLVRAAARALSRPPDERAPDVDVSHIGPAPSVRDAVVAVVERLARRERATFRSLCDGATERIEVVVRFLALLELFKLGAVELHQADRFGDIAARWTGSVDASTAADAVDEYAAGV
jgi:segregation and condensation protein A